MAVGFVALIVNAQEVTGEWSGQLNVTPQMKLKLVFHIEDKAIFDFILSCL
ncbi:MAG: hypothetical protein K2N48_05230 [Muribaculaceae bacterium]|nr:hypothetical protein [Muribaculaceae bacterium]